MNIIRNMFTIKVIAFIVLSSLFMISMKSTTVEASETCPCNLISSFLFIKGLVFPIGGKPELCFVENDKTSISGVNSGCEFELGVSPFESSGLFACGAEFACSSFSGAGEWSFLGFGSEAADSCVKQLQLLIWWLHIPECPPG